MPVATATLIAGLGLAVGAAGTVATVASQNQTADLQKKANDIKNTQMNLEAARQSRDIARKALLARSQALTSATSQGAAGGSGLQGGFAQVFGQEGSGQQRVNQDLGLANQLFDVNQDITDSNTNTSTFSAIAGVGDKLMQNQDMLGRVGSYITGKSTWF